MPLLSVTANDIDAAGLSLDAALPLEWLQEELADGSLTGVAPGHVSLRLSRSGKDSIVVRGKVKAELVTPCARCMEPSRVPVETELTLLLQPAKVVQKADARANGKPKGKPAEEEEYEFSADEADVDHYDGETVVLDPFVREAILLEVPNFPLCSEDCAGIRPAALEADSEPGEAPIDPRLAPLAALRDKLAAAQAARRPSRPPPRAKPAEESVKASKAPAAELTSKKKNKE